MQTPGRSLRKLLYFVGPGDVVGSFGDWRRGIETPSETTRTYSGEAFRYCVAADMAGIFVSSHPRREIVGDTRFTVENRPKPAWRRTSGAMYHLRDLVYGLQLLRTALGARPDVVVMDSGTTHWFVLVLFRVLSRARLFVTFHNAYHPMHRPRRRPVDRLFDLLNAFTFRHCVDGCLAASEECRRQYLGMAGERGRAVLFSGLFDPAAFQAVAPAPADPVPDRPLVLFAGRIEPSKGVFDLLAACERLAARGLRFDLAYCGDGSAMGQLRERVASSTLGERVVLHGRLDRTRLLAVYRQSHVLVVPTQTGFAEGFAMVCAEAIVCGVPVVASDVVPAAEMLAPATLTYPADDVEALADVLGRVLVDDREHERLKAACPALASPFFDLERGLGAAMKRLIDGV